MIASFWRASCDIPPKKSVFSLMARVGVDAFASAWAMQEGCDFDQNVFLVKNWNAVPTSNDERMQFTPQRKGAKR
jgi:hypothetical protein